MNMYPVTRVCVQQTRCPFALASLAIYLSKYLDQIYHIKKYISIRIPLDIIYEFKINNYFKIKIMKDFNEYTVEQMEYFMDWIQSDNVVYYRDSEYIGNSSYETQCIASSLPRLAHPYPRINQTKNIFQYQ